MYRTVCASSADVGIRRSVSRLHLCIHEHDVSVSPCQSVDTRRKTSWANVHPRTGWAENAEINTKRSVILKKKNIYFCSWRCKRRDREEKRRRRRRRKRKKNGRRVKERGEGKERKRQTGKEKLMKKKKKSSLSGFGNGDSWGPFVLITAEQRFCRY